MSFPRNFLALLAAFALAQSCLVPDVSRFEPAEVESNQCDSDEDCAPAVCDTDQGFCRAGSTGIGVVLLQIEPPVADRGFGGRTFFRRIDDLAERVALQRPLDIELVEPADVVGGISLVQPDPNCKTRPVNVQLTPVEHYLGLSVSSYKGRSVVELDPGETTLRVVPDILRNSYRLEGVPEGSYDVYVWEDEPPPEPDGCEIAPQLRRDVDVVAAGGEGTLRALPLPQEESSPSKLLVQIPWRAELSNWSVAVVHPVTGDLMSTSSPLTNPALDAGASPQEQLFAEEELWFAEGVKPDYVDLEQLRLQLTPPLGVQRPTISVQLGVLLTGPQGEAVAAVSSLRSFQNLVQFGSWVWRKGQPEAPVAGTVTFEAVDLEEVPQGIRARLSVTASIQTDGRVDVQLPPGTYEVTVVPEPSGDIASDRLAAIRHTVKIGTTNPSQAGQVLEVPIAPVLSGELSLATGGDDLSRFEIQATGVQPILLDPTVANSDAPKGNSRLIGDFTDQFSVPIPDCGGCGVDTPARYDVRVVPPPGSHHAWTVVPDVWVHEDLDLGELQVNAPARVAGTLTFKTISTRDREARAFPGALIRAYALLDREGALVTKGDTPYCYELQSPPDALESCAARAVQIGRARSVQGGQFELLLPTQLIEIQ